MAPPGSEVSHDSRPDEVPVAVLEAYGLEAAASHRGGLINRTFIALGEPPVVIQRLHPIFGPEVNLDIAAITEHLAARGLETPRLVPTRDGALWIELDGAVWRALTFVPGETVEAVADPALAAAAGELVGRFHAALADCDHVFAFTRAGVHDTAAHLARLDRLRAGPAGGDSIESARDLAAEILAEAGQRPTWPALEARVAHGDLKISNIRFASIDPPVARCLIDLDTLGRLTLPYELGDALRSWCNGAEDGSEPRFRQDLFEAAIAGYWRGSEGLPERAEIEAVPAGTQVVALELAARFCADVFEDRYFGWDPTRYPSRRAHNLARARNQLALSRQVGACRSVLEDVIRRLR